MTDAALGAIRIAASDELESPGRRALRRLFKRKGAVAGLVVIATSVLLAILAPLVVPYDPIATSWSLVRKPPSALHWFGTDELGRDILARVIFGARISLAVGFTTVFLAGGIGVLLGLVAGYFGGWVDNVIMRLVDVLLAFPFLVLAIALVSVLRPSLLTVIVVLSLWGWLAYARLTRGVTLALREKEFVEASIAQGARPVRVMFAEILPNIASGVLVFFTLIIAANILTEAALSFLGAGVQPPNPSWGTQIAEGQERITTAPWLTLAPGIAIVLTVLSLNIFGDGLRDALDPRAKVRIEH